MRLRRTVSVLQLECQLYCMSLVPQVCGVDYNSESEDHKNRAHRRDTAHGLPHGVNKEPPCTGGGERSSGGQARK